MGSTFPLIYGSAKNGLPTIPVSYNNVVDPGAPLFKVAQQNLDKAKGQLVTLVQQRDDAQNALGILVSKYGQTYADVTGPNGSGNTYAINRIVNGEKYGYGASSIWGGIVGDLHNKYTNTQKINPQEWQGAGTANANGSVIFSKGVAGDDPWNAAQRELLGDWVQRYADEFKKLTGLISAKNTEIVNKTGEIERLQKRLDTAIANEERASGQRIKENESSPEYLAAKAAADKVAYDAAAKRQTTNTVLLLSVFALAAGAAVLIFRKA